MVDSLLTAIIRADGDALVMHVGEQPYVVAPAGPIELSARPLTLDAVAGMLGQLLPADSRRALDELGAIEHELPNAEGHGDRFTVVAARGGDDIWIEIRRHRAPPLKEPAAPAPDAAPPPVTLTAAAPPAAPAVAPAPAPAGPIVVPAAEGMPPAAAVPAAEPPSGAVVSERSAPARVADTPPVRPGPAAPEPATLRLSAAPRDVESPFADLVSPEEGAGSTPARPPSFAERRHAAASRVTEPTTDWAMERETEAAEWPGPAMERPAPVLVPPEPAPDRAALSEPMAAVVLPLARNPVRAEPPARPLPPPRIAGLDRLLRLSAARGANTLYLMSQAKPSVRVDGEITGLEGEPVLSAAEVESLLLDLAPERSREALRNGEGTEWMSEVPEVGRIRCHSFRDYRGPGGIFRIISNRPTTADQLGLSREVQALCAEPEGLVLVAGPRASGKSTVISALVDLINRTRNDYVITIENQINCTHESRGCLISQREVRGNNDELAAAVRAALRESPDIFVIDNLRSPKVISLALDAMETGHLVIAAVAAHMSVAAIGRILDQLPPERREQAQLSLAEGLRGVVSQVLVHKLGGGRVAARELLINTPSIANLISEGQLSQLPLALDSGRKHGMVPLNDALAAFVQSGVVDVKDAYRKSYDRQAFLAVLRREGVDTSFVERPA